MLLVKQQLLADLGQALSALAPGHSHNPQLESPKVAAHGDWAITAALQWAKPLGQAPRQVAERLRADLQARPAFAQWVDSMEIAGPGFINLRLKPAAHQNIVREVLQAGLAFGHQASSGERILVEFVSANPTGPLHVGHGRQAALGDAICQLLQSQGHAVYR